MADDRHYPLHRDADPIRGWWGINVADQEDYLPPFQAVASRNWINRLGLKNDNIGVLSTRPGTAESPKYEQNGLADTAGTTYPVRLLAKFYPDATIAAGSQVLRIHFTNFQKFDKATGNWDDLMYCAADGGGAVNDLSVGAGAHPDGGYYPQWIIFDVPSGPWFCWVDPENGLYVYDGVEVTKVSIPRHNVAGNITGALWLAQVDAMLIVSGCLEASQSDIAWYSKAGSAIEFSPDEGAGSWEVWGVDSRSKASPPKRVTGLAELGRNLIVFTEDMRYVWIGIGTYLQDRSVEIGAGCAWGNTICAWEGSLYWCGKDGVYEWSRGEPRRVHKEIWNDFQYIEWSDGAGVPNLQKFHSFIFEDQYWLNVQTSLHTGDYNNTNFILDLGIRKEFGLNHWYILDIPMGPAFDSKGGLDFGALFFASPIDYNPGGAAQYRTFRYGFDDSNPLGGAPQIFADIYTDGTPQVRTAHAIVCEWETGTLHYGDPLVGKEHQGILVRFGITDAGGDYPGSFTRARVEYTILDGAETKTLDFPTDEVADQEFHYLSIGEDEKNKSHFIKLKWQVSTINKRVHIKQAYGLFRPLPAALWSPR